MACGRLIGRLAVFGGALGLMTACATSPLPWRRALAGFGPQVAPAADSALPDTLYALKPLPSFAAARALYGPEDGSLRVFTDEGGFCLTLGESPAAKPKPLPECLSPQAPAPESGGTRTSR